jgi:fumarylacetoacetate (FAA) hydrolase
MKLLRYTSPAGNMIGLVHEGCVLPPGEVDGVRYPDTLDAIIRERSTYEAGLREVDARFKKGDYADKTIPYEGLAVLSPITRPASLRDGYAFRQHVESARRNRGVPMIDEFDQFPVFYFTNAGSVTGPGEVRVMADHLQKLDFELEVACVLGAHARNVRAEAAEELIFGYAILNDLSARVLQMEEMQLSLGPAKGKDFANVLGPWLVTPDELAPFAVAPAAGHVGTNYALTMTARVNGIEVSRGSWASMHWTFAELIERCAYGADLHPTDVIGSGTVGTGCFLELNGTAARLDPTSRPQWLTVGDVVELEIEQLGVLRTTFALEGDFSLLGQKKGVN